MASTGDDPPAGPELERFQPYLELLARLHIDSRLRGLVDPSDLVQQTLLKAHQKWNQVRGTTDGQRAAWVRAILAHEIADALRKCLRRNEDRRRSLEQSLNETSLRLDAWLKSDLTSASGKVMRQEQFITVAEALASLPQDQRSVIELHYLQDRTLPEISREMKRTSAAVAGLLRRGLKTLRERISEES